MKILITLLSCLAACALAHNDSSVYMEPQQGSKELDRINALPGQPSEFNLTHYSGYITINSSSGKELFYYFVESHNCDSKPLVLWLNGGPGCSSFGNGAMLELGPLVVNQDGKTLSLNEYAWTNVANILFLESPVGVGFSYSDSSLDYTLIDDQQIADDSYTFLLYWLERFPEYKCRDFFIAGESYAGHYVPQLAHKILQNNEHRKETTINLRGIIIGNPSIDMETQYKAQTDYLWSRDMMSDEAHEGISLNCNFTYPFQPPSEECQKFWYLGFADQGNFSEYNIYAPINCVGSTDSIPGSAICAAEYVNTYLNAPEVQTSLHVRAIPHFWQYCNDTTLRKYPIVPSVLPTIQDLLGKNNLTIWFYSGDLDSALSMTSTKYAINKLGLSIKTSWYPWYSASELGGYIVGYENLTFVTVRGAGHLVPYDQPARALSIFSSFLEGKLPSDK